MKKLLGGVEVLVNEDGFLSDPTVWTEDVARDLAREIGLELNNMHWQLIRYLREQYRQGVEMTIRKVGQSGIVDIKEFYQLFPGGPLKNASKIAGLPRPTSCI